MIEMILFVYPKCIDLFIDYLPCDYDLWVTMCALAPVSTTNGPFLWAKEQLQIIQSNHITLVDI